jgi:hypothetical protein
MWDSAQARPVTVTRLVSGALVSVALWLDPDEGRLSLRFKRSDDGGATWPSDEDATIIIPQSPAQLGAGALWTLFEVAGTLHLTDGLSEYYVCNGAGTKAEQWKRMAGL